MGLLFFATSGMVSARDNPKFVVTVPLFPSFPLPWCPHPQTPWAFTQLDPQKSLFPVLGQSSLLSLRLKLLCQY